MIASVTEPAVEVIDGEMAKLGGEVTRRPVVDVMAELEAGGGRRRRGARGSEGTAREAQGGAEHRPRRARRVAEGEAPRRVTASAASVCP